MAALSFTPRDAVPFNRLLVAGVVHRQPIALLTPLSIRTSTLLWSREVSSPARANGYIVMNSLRDRPF
jgi:hypothetical protein